MHEDHGDDMGISGAVDVSCRVCQCVLGYVRGCQCLVGCVSVFAGVSGGCQCVGGVCQCLLG